MKKRIDFFLTKIDEELFSKEINKTTSNIAFIDGFDKTTKTPFEKSSIEHCDSDFIRIWNKNLFPNIEYGETTFAYFQKSSNRDPTSKLEKDNFIASGFLSVDISKDQNKAKEMFEFIKILWNSLNKITSKNLIVVDLDSADILNKAPKNVVAGKNAIEWCRSNENHFFKFRSVQVYLKPF
ncbi:MAG: hypothetical protein LUM44_22480 [Pyrinomonadaceae bacterium]|nr:hypothetical protein [Pyrinomonadaceae bacterium]